MSEDKSNGGGDAKLSRRRYSPQYNITSSVLEPDNKLWKAFSPLMDLTKSTIYRLGSYGVSPRPIGKLPHFAICKFLISHSQGPAKPVNRDNHSHAFKKDLGMPNALQPDEDDFDAGWRKGHIFAYERFLQDLELCFMSMSLGNIVAVVDQVNDEMKRIDNVGSKITSGHGGGLWLVSTHMGKNPLKIGVKNDVHVADFFMFTYIVRDRNGPKLFAYRTTKENKLPKEDDKAPPNKKSRIKDTGKWAKKFEIAAVDDPFKELKVANVPFTAIAEDFYSINGVVNINYNKNSVICPINEKFFSGIEEEKASVDKNEANYTIIDTRMGNAFGVECFENLTNCFVLNRGDVTGGVCGGCSVKFVLADTVVKTKSYLGETLAIDYERTMHLNCFFELMKTIHYSPMSKDFTYAPRCRKQDKAALQEKLSPLRQTTLKF